MRIRTLLTACCSAAAVALPAEVFADQQIGNVVQREFNGALGFRSLLTSGDDLEFNRDVFANETVKTPAASASTVVRFQDKTHESGFGLD